MDLNDRIQKIINYLNLSASEFAKEIGVQSSNISHILTKRNKPSLELITKIRTKFPQIQLEWIIEGKGNMTSSSPPSSYIHETINPKSANLFNQEQDNNLENKPIFLKENNTENNFLSKEKMINGKIKKIIFFYEDGKFEIFE